MHETKWNAPLVGGAFRVAACTLRRGVLTVPWLWVAWRHGVSRVAMCVDVSRNMLTRLRRESMPPETQANA